jgi:hypothetical protein
VFTRDVVEEVSKLTEQLDGDIQDPGSIQLVRELIENDLVDEIHLMTIASFSAPASACWERPPTIRP